MILLWIVLLILALHILGLFITLVHKNETDSIKEYGQKVTTSHGNMHLFEMGNHDNPTLILLPGLGNALPCADFGPLMRDLSTDYHVICAEYLGVGFSDDTDLLRSNENYIKELREALLAFGCEPPYILVPHSISGVYCEYYAAKFPEEIDSIIELDCPNSASSNGIPVSPNWIYHISRFQQTCGVTRFFNFIMPSMQKTEYGYTKKELLDYRTFSYHNIVPSLANQNHMINTNIKELETLPYPSGIPTLKLQSEQAVKRFGTAFQEEHLKRLGPDAKAYMIKGSVHMMHEKHHKQIMEQINSFLASK